MPIRLFKIILVVSVVVILNACGGGGGGGSGVTPPPPPATVNYTVTLTDMTLTDRQTNGAVATTGLPVSGATATRTP